MNVTALLLAQTVLAISSPMTWGIGVGTAGLALRLAPQVAWQKLGLLLALIGIALIGVALPPLDAVLPQVLFWLMATLAVLASGAAVTSRSPVYAAIWFAVSLLGTAGLFLLQGRVGFQSVLHHVQGLLEPVLFHQLICLRHDLLGLLAQLGSTVLFALVPVRISLLDPFRDPILRQGKVVSGVLISRVPTQGRFVRFSCLGQCRINKLDLFNIELPQ